MRRSTWFTLLILAPLFFVGIGLSRAAEHETQPIITLKASTETPLAVSSVWVVVNLFTGQTSKQAVLLRDKLLKAGAEGQGIIMPYKDVSVENIARIKPSFLALSPNGIPWCRYRGRNGQDLQHFFASLKVIVEEMQIPVMGICGGHQALALAFGGKVGPIRGGEDDCFSYGRDPTERGRQSVEVVRYDPLFLGMGKVLSLLQHHYDEVKRLPAGFVNLAENEACPYQIIRHSTCPAYGVQAHSEYWHKAKPDGGTLLRNFLEIVRSHNQLVRGQNSEGSGPFIKRKGRTADSSTNSSLF